MTEPTASLRSAPVDGFALAYHRSGVGPPVVLLHGWPGDRHDFRLLEPQLTGAADVVVPDLRGFGESDKHPDADAAAYSAAAQARSVLALLDELDLAAPVLVGYDIGSRVAQSIARTRPDRIAGLVISPPVPGVGRRILEPDAVQEYWYQAFHDLPLIEQVLDGRPEAVRSYLAHFWEHWSGSGYRPETAQLDRLAESYGAPGAFTASINYYRAGAGTVAQSLAETAPDRCDRIATPTILLWPGEDVLYPAQWSDRVEEFFAAAELRHLPASGHFTPLEAPDEFAGAVGDLLARVAQNLATKSEV